MEGIIDILNRKRLLNVLLKQAHCCAWDLKPVNMMLNVNDKNV